MGDEVVGVVGCGDAEADVGEVIVQLVLAVTAAIVPSRSGFGRERVDTWWLKKWVVHQVFTPGAELEVGFTEEAGLVAAIWIVVGEVVPGGHVVSFLLGEGSE